MLNVVENPRAVIGDNSSPFELSAEEINDLFAEAKNFLDGDPIKTQAEADAVGMLTDKLRKAKKLADDRRKAEARPFDEAKAEIQARYNPLIQEGRGKADLAIMTCKEALAPFLAAQEVERRQRAEIARREAEAAQKAAQEALRASQAADLEKREAAERLVREAKAAEKAATRVENELVSVKGGERAITQRTIAKPYLIDGVAAARHYWPTRRAEIQALLQTFAEADVRAGLRTIPGFDVIDEVAIQ